MQVGTNLPALATSLMWLPVPGHLIHSWLRVFKGTVNAETPEGSTVEIVANDAWSKKNKKITVNGANVVTADAQTGYL